MVQLPNVTASDPRRDESRQLRPCREVQWPAALSTPNVGLVTTIDIGEPDIHPVNKQEVGRRLAITAEGMVYGEAYRVFRAALRRYAGGRKGDSPPLCPRQQRIDDEGWRALKGFAIAGKDGEYVMANAVISGDTVVDPHPAWLDRGPIRLADNPTCNLCNGAGRPSGVTLPY